MGACIALISPYNNIYSYGLRSLAACLRRAGHRATTLYLVNEFTRPYSPAVIEQVIELCRGADLIGVSTMSNHLPGVIRLTGALRARLGAPVVLGGVHATVAPDECAAHADVVVVGEGEQTLLELAAAAAAGRPLEGIVGTVALRGGEVRHHGIRPLIAAEQLPLVDNDFSSDHVLVAGRLRPLDTRQLGQHMTREYMTLSSLGCPFSCSYCINSKLNRLHEGHKVRFRPVEHVIAELVEARRRMPFLRRVAFDDDAFMARPLEGVRELAARYREQVGLPFFISGLNPVYLTEEKLELLLAAGLDRVKMGIQSGSPRTRADYNRRAPLERVIGAARLLAGHRRELKLTGYDIILDNPFERDEDVIQTIELLAALPPPFTLNLFSLTFYPGTQLHRRAVEAGLVCAAPGQVYGKHYHDVDSTYLNLIVALYAIGKLPAPLKELLLRPELVARLRRVPRPLLRAALMAGYVRRGLDLLARGDPHTLARHLRVRLFS